MSRSANVGDRVYAVRNADEKKVYLFGHGVYQGEHPNPHLGGIGNPRIELDNGKTIWGFLCWWGPEVQFEDWVKGREIVEVEIPDLPDPVKEEAQQE